MKNDVNFSPKYCFITLEMRRRDAIRWEERKAAEK